MAFTERITGRAPESRGNGLKFVRQVVSNYALRLEFQTGNANLKLEKGTTNLNINESEQPTQGCFAIITF